MNSRMDWPADADGDVMRRLQGDGFDFAREVEIDFNIDFNTWPPDPVFAELLESHMPSARISMQEDYILVQVRGFLTYLLVTKMQSDLTQISERFGGRCLSWGVYSDQR